MSSNEEVQYEEQEFDNLYKEQRHENRKPVVSEAVNNEMKEKLAQRTDNMLNGQSEQPQESAPSESPVEPTAPIEVANDQPDRQTTTTTTPTTTMTPHSNPKPSTIAPPPPPPPPPPPTPPAQPTPPDWPSDNSALDKLTEDLSMLLDSEIDTDVTIRADGKTFPAHQLILKVRCPELLKLARKVLPLQPVEPPPIPSAGSLCASSGKKKGKQQVLRMKQQPPTPQEEPVSYVIDLDSPLFTEELVTGMLRYIYTAKIEVVSDIAQELLVVAADHRLFELKTRLEMQLWNSLCHSNCVKLLVFANERRNGWDCRELKRRALTYVHDNIKAVIEMDDFKKLHLGPAKLLEEMVKALVLGDEFIRTVM